MAGLITPILKYLTKSPEETQEAGKALAERLKANAVVALCGELGAGKTTFVQGIVQQLGGMAAVTSPTFIYLNIYDAPLTIFHFDLYRLKSPASFLEMGFEEFFHKDGVCLIEWPERILPLLPKDILQVRFEHGERGQRHISWSCA